MVDMLCKDFISVQVWIKFVSVYLAKVLHQPVQISVVYVSRIQMFV